MASEYLLNSNNRKIINQGFVPFEGKKVLVWQKEAETVPPQRYVIVAGYMVSDVYTTKDGARAVKCENVEKEKRNALEELLKKKGFEGPVSINFNK